MIFFQVLAALLLLPLTVLLFLLFNLYIIYWAYLVSFSIFVIFYALLFGLVFLNLGTAIWVFFILSILYLIRMSHMSNNLNTKKNNQHKKDKQPLENNMNEEKKLILEMLKEGKISVDEAQILLDGTEAAHEKSPLFKSLSKKFLRVLVIEENSTRVNINIPIALAEVGLKLIPKDKLKIEGLDINIDDILKLIKEGVEGELLNVETVDKGKQVSVKIFID